MPKTNSSKTTLGNEPIHRSQTLPKSACQHFYQSFQLIKDKLSWKTCLLIRSKILQLFVTTLTARNMYSFHNWQKFTQGLQRYISQKGKTISGIFNTFLKSTWKFVYLGKKDQLDSLNISDVFDAKKYSSLNVKKQIFQNNLQDWAHSRIPNTAQISLAVLFSKFSINPRQSELEKMSLNHIENLRSVS